MKLNIAIILMILIGFLQACEQENQSSLIQEKDELYRGIDLSFQPKIETRNIQYKDENGENIDLLPYLKEKGVNLVRLRLWHTPSDTHSSLEEVINYAKRVKNQNMDILLDIHYSDTWADPAHQSLPFTWENLNFETLEDSVYQYTSKVLSRFQQENILPEIVQIGNETNGGFLWDFGKVGGDFDNNWLGYGQLCQSAISAIKNINSDIKIMFHFAGTQGSQWYFENLINQGVEFDMIGLSYYSLWHGKDLEQINQVWNSLAQEFDKDMMIVETAYPWTLAWNDFTNNLYGLEEQLMSEYSASPTGQKQFLEDLKNRIKNIDNQKGKGFCYWAGDWVTFDGQESTNGSSWENLAIFDFDNKVLPVIEVFEKE